MKYSSISSDVEPPPLGTVTIKGTHCICCGRPVKIGKKNGTGGAAFGRGKVCERCITERARLVRKA